MRTRWCLPLAALMTIAAVPAAAAHGIDVDVVARGLDNPRHVAVAKDGDVYVAESGRGGDHVAQRSCFDSPEGFACTGRTGAVTKIGPRGQERVLRGLASFAPVSGDNAIGPHGVFASGHDLYVTNGGPTAPTRDDELVLRDPTLTAEEPISRLYGTVLEAGRRGVRLVADAWAFERDVNPDRELGNPIVDSNPVDVLEDRGRLVIADAGGNSLVRTGHRGRLEALTIFPNVGMMQAVPTGVVEGPDGAYYVSQLTGFPFPVGGAKVFRVDPRSGRFSTYASGFTNAIDLDFGHDGTLYVLELDSDSILGGSTDGGLWTVPRRGTPRKVALPAGTLTEPGGIAVGRRDTLYVTNRSRSARVGEVLRIDLGRR
ncbi:MAG TPA: ScyD/ScyE family protein [Solirubrobacteraceae bacterium]|nr:ScyD/ScyE family protein [Solirubrobacteraceae bacterium]